MPRRVLAEDPYISIPLSEFEALHERIRALETAISNHIAAGHDQNHRLQAVL